MSSNSQWFQTCRQSKFKVPKKVYLSKESLLRWTFFLYFKLSRPASLEPLGVHSCYVLHFKGLIYGKVEPEAQGRDSTFSFCHVHLKKAILLHK